jgi:hypothetical protein
MQKVLSLFLISIILLSSLALGTVLAKKITSPKVVEQITKTQIITEVKKCVETSKENVGRCMDRYFEKTIRNQPTKTVMKLLTELVNENDLVRGNDHPIAHAVGRANFTKYGSIQDAFNDCTSDVFAGCLHGGVERALFSNQELDDMENKDEKFTLELIKKKLPTICSPESYKNAEYPINARVACFHGLGHAILFSTRYKYEDSLNLCKQIPDNYDVEGCYGGVVMENVTGFDVKRLDVKVGDYHYPCNKLSDKGQLSLCYNMQPSVMLDMHKLTWSQIVDECKTKAIKGYEKDCIAGVGRQMSAYIHNGSYQLAYDSCVRAQEYQSDCVEGAVQTSISATLKIEESMKYCALFTQDWKDWCEYTAESYFKATLGDRRV